MDPAHKAAMKSNLAAMFAEQEKQEASQKAAGRKNKGKQPQKPMAASKV